MSQAIKNYNSKLENLGLRDYNRNRLLTSNGRDGIMTEQLIGSFLNFKSVGTEGVYFDEIN